MRYRMSTHRFPQVITAFAMLLIISGTVQAGITLSPKGTQLTGDPKISYEFTATLTSGSLVPGAGDSFEINKLLGINDVSPAAADYSVILNGKNDSKDWAVTYSLLPSKVDVKFDGKDYKLFASDVTFTYIGKSTLTGPEDLGDFTIKETTQDKSLPPWTAGVSLPSETYTWTVGPIGKTNTGGGTLVFSVVPEPSSLVVVALVGTSLMGVGLLRRWCRVA